MVGEPEVNGTGRHDKTKANFALCSLLHQLNALESGTMMPVEGEMNGIAHI